MSAPSQTSAKGASGAAPRVSIGLPVYNGAKYLRTAIDSILAQDFRDFELIISDNASTDETESICSELALRDPRIRYVRQKSNVGAAENFNRVFALARGQYFKWAAHDDVLSPRFLSRCVEVLDRDAGVVLCSTRSAVIGESGEVLHRHDETLPTDSEDPGVRFAAMIKGHRCYEVFGVFRTNDLRQTNLIGKYANGDGILLAKLSLRGRFHEVPEYLFMPRLHAGQSMSQYGCYDRKGPDYHAYTAWFDPAKATRIVFPHWRRLCEYLKAIAGAPLSLREKARCLRKVARWMKNRRRHLQGDVVIAFKTAIHRLRPQRG